MTRDQLIEAGARGLRSLAHLRALSTQALDVFEPLIRADEQKREALRGPSVAWYDAHERAVLTDLRAQVNALDAVREGGLIRRGDVLALLDGQ